MSSSTTLTRSKSAPQPFAAPASTRIQRSLSQQFVENPVRRASSHQQQRDSRQGLLSSLPRDDPFNLSGFFPSRVSAIEREGEEWEWLREEEGEEEDRVRYRGDEEGPMRGGRSAIFGQETSDAIRGEDKLGVLSLKDVSLFSTSAGEYDYDYRGRLMSPYAHDEVLDEHSLYLAQCARRERLLASSAVAAGAPYGQVFLAGEEVP